MTTGTGSMSHGQVHSVCDGLECSPSKGQASSPIHGGKKGGGKKSKKSGKKSSGKKMED
jgi:hypothetical protein